MLRRLTRLVRKTRLRPIGKRGREDRDQLATVRYEVFARDGGRCQRCSVELKPWAWDCHHVARRRGPDRNSMGNLVALCRGCHSYVHEHPRIAKTEGFLR